VTDLWVIGVNHRTAPVTVRERLAVPLRELPALLSGLRTTLGCSELVILSTCNRVEYYLVSADPPASLRVLLDVMGRHGGLAPGELMPHLCLKRGPEAIRHLFAVTAGLESMVLGEVEVSAQVKQAYLTAHAHGACGPLLNRLFQRALHSTKVLRTHTRIGQGQGSIGSVVAGLARQQFGGQLGACDVLLWGTGKAATATARHLIKSGIRQLWVVSRTQDRAEEFASLCQAGWLSWEQAQRHLGQVDLAIVCTEAPHYVLDVHDIARAAPARAGRPLCIVDLAVPRNVDPAIGARDGITLYDIDELRLFAQQGIALRQRELSSCHALIEEQVEHFARWWTTTARREEIPCRVAVSYA